MIYLLQRFFIACFTPIGLHLMKRRFKKYVVQELKRIRNVQPDLLTQADIEHLPEVVRKYLRYTGFIGKEKIANFRSTYIGGIRNNPEEEFMPFRSVQYNFMDQQARYFYMVAKKKGIPAIGLHMYQYAKAIFQIKILGLFPVVNAKGPKLDQAETVTVLNDMFFMAPGSLIDKRIEWEVVDELRVKAVFTNEHIRVSALIHFDEEGRLINFISHDRFDTNGKEYKNHPWETPALAFREINNYRLPSKARLIYKRPEGDFCYGEFELNNIAYNCRKYS